MSLFTPHMSVHVQITSYPRTLGCSVRHEDDRRKKKRKEKMEKKAKEAQARKEEIRRLRNLQQKEMTEKLEKLSRITGKSKSLLIHALLGV